MRMELTQERLQQVVYYDPETGIMYRYLKSIEDRPIGSDHGEGYLRARVDGKRYLIHRLAFLYMTGRWPNNQIDHIDGNRLNNKWANLREASNQNNSKNQRIPSSNTSNTIGVYWHGREKKWRAQIVVNGHLKYLGSFQDLEEAVKSRKEAEEKYSFHKNHGNYKSCIDAV